MKRHTQKSVREKIKIGQEVLEEKEVSLWLMPPMRSLEETLQGSPYERLKRKRKQELPEVESMSILHALWDGNCEPFFQALRYDPTTLFSSPIYRMTIGKWFRLKGEDKAAREFLRRIGKELAFIQHGNVARIEVEEREPRRRATKSKSAAVTRLMTKFNKWRNSPFKMPPEVAMRQVEQEFQETTKLAPELQKEVVIEFRKKIANDRDRKK